MNKEVVASYPIKCIGASSRIEDLDPNSPPVDVSITIYRDCERDVGCSFIVGIFCQKIDKGFISRCKHFV